MERFHGILAATVTPFTSDDSVDEAATAKLANSLIEAGVHGLIPTGSTGEFFTMTMDERKKVVEITIEAANGRVPVIAHTAAVATREVIELSRHAEKSGAQGLMIVPPYYEPLSENDILGHYAAVAAAADLPIMLYNIPVCSGFDIRPEFMLRLAEEIPTVQYIKDSTGNAAALQQLIAVSGERVTVFNGSDTLSLYGLVAGTAGCVWGAANVTPRECVDLYELVVEKQDLAGAKALWTHLLPLNAFFEREGYIAAVKAGAALTGRQLGDPRAPIGRLSNTKTQELRILLQNLSALAA